MYAAAAAPPDETKKQKEEENFKHKQHLNELFNIGTRMMFVKTFFFANIFVLIFC